MTSLAEKLVAIHGALDAKRVPHAFGGALALAWCTQRARGTIDIDVNVFLDVGETQRALAGLPSEVDWTDADEAALRQEGQARLWWDTTPIDLFLDTTEFHRQVAGRAESHLMADTQIPFLSCADLAVFKAFFNRTKDWADLEEMAAAGTLDVDRVTGILARYLGADDDRIPRLQSLDRFTG